MPASIGCRDPVVELGQVDSNWLRRGIAKRRSPLCNGCFLARQPPRLNALEDPIELFFADEEGIVLDHRSSSARMSG